MWVALVLGVGCAGDEPSGEDRPLRPLVYTEHPDLTPEGAAVREQRLLRQLRGGAELSGGWGRLEEPDAGELPLIDDEEALGRALFEALIERNEALWDHLFIAPESYAELVKVSEDRAREFVDVQMGGALATWESFEPSRSSEGADGGLGRLLELQGLELGEGRTIQGPVAGEDEEVVQHWGNVLRLRYAEADVEFELRIPRIFRVPSPHDPTRKVLVLASPVEADRRLQTLVALGLHLKPELLRSREYPFPLKEGNFWRYRRYNKALGQDETVDPLDFAMGGQAAAGTPRAPEVIVEVMGVEQYGTWRLVHLMRSYEDADFTRAHERWVLTPRRIYYCNSRCQANIDDLSYLLEYFEYQVPIFSFPLEPGQRWGRAGLKVGSDAASFSVDESWHHVETPAGGFVGAYAIEGTGPLTLSSPYFKLPGQRRYVVPGRGVVRRELREPDAGGQLIDVVEELVEYRIMP
ncbi:hypothetical protein DL240_16955 [Lujinxingia litoralis]|uniref:Uncharacterized protein n=1 Tax=Lujinxingia litoralis TaxID=2211119 RepID=A0A328C7H1_9DELT|nr:hypothetical protein DL240_16955 [Lujinxingia litoralis]